MTEKRYEPTVGATALLRSLTGTVGDLKEWQKNLKNKEYEVVVAQNNLKYATEYLKKTQRETAGLIIDLTKLGCPEEEIKRYYSEYNNHDIAEWIQYEGG